MKPPPTTRVLVMPSSDDVSVWSSGLPAYSGVYSQLTRCSASSTLSGQTMHDVMMRNRTRDVSAGPMWNGNPARSGLAPMMASTVVSFRLKLAG